jgi:hypothetical protein
MTPAEFTRFMQDEVNKWGAAIDQMSIGVK